MKCDAWEVVVPELVLLELEGRVILRGGRMVSRWLVVGVQQL